MQIGQKLQRLFANIVIPPGQVIKNPKGFPAIFRRLRKPLGAGFSGGY
jgi:hypothetical protein